jgi:dTDP-4-dehydrorhamnose 3,5-epimerase
MSIEFNITTSNIISDVKIIQPSVSLDKRGTIWTSYLSSEIDKLTPNNIGFIHDKFSESKKNVLRGIHGDEKTWKLVTSVYGEIYQVVVDYRESSPTYLKWDSFTINKENQKLILIPPGVGNAYYVTSDNALYHYKLAYLDEYNDVDSQFTLAWNDDRFGIKWPTNSPILSERDFLKYT